MMRKNITDYDVLIFDLDGTLYDQPKLRFIMAVRLVKYYLCHPFKLRELLLIKEYRSIKENWDNYIKSDLPDAVKEKSTQGMEAMQCAYAAIKTRVTYEEARAVVDMWIFKNPLDALRKSQDMVLKNYIDKSRNEKKTVVILSDYPAEEKLAAMGIEVDGIYCTMQDNIGEMKPSPKGLEVILNDFKITSDIALMIGDRFEKDGLCAQSAGVDELILPRRISKRKKIYEKMLA